MKQTHLKLLYLAFGANLLVVLSLFYFSGDLQTFFARSHGLRAQAISGGGVYTVSKLGGATFTTIQACAEVAQPGETCRVEAGSYDERVTPPMSGLPGKPISFEASGKVRVRGFRLDGKNFIKVSGFDITTLALTQDLFPGVFLEGSNGITIVNNTIHDTVSECIGMRSQVAANRSNNNVIRGNRILNCGAAKSAGPAPGITIFGDNNLVEGNDISYVGEDFTQVMGGEKNVIRTNIFHDNLKKDGTAVAHIDGVQVACATKSVPIRGLLIENNQQYNTTSSDTHFVNILDGQCEMNLIIVRNNLIKNLPISSPSRKIGFRSYNNDLTDSTPALLTKVSAADGGSDRGLIVEDATPFQDGWAGITPDWISADTPDNIAQVDTINYSGNVISLRTALKRSPGDKIWFFKSNGKIVPQKKTSDTYYSSDVIPPSAPAQFKANVILAEEVDFTWYPSTDNVGVTGYRIYRDGDSVASAKVEPARDITARQNTIYTYAITALDAAGNESDPTYLDITTRHINPADTTPPKREKTAEPVIPYRNGKIATPSPTPSPVVSVQAPVPSTAPYVPPPAPVYTPPPAPRRAVSVPSDPKPLPDLSATSTDDTPFEFEEKVGVVDVFKDLINDYFTGFKTKWQRGMELLNRVP